MKNTLLVIIVLMSISYSNVLGNDNSIIADTPRTYRGINVQDYTLKGNGEECWFLYDLDSSKISRSDCLSLTNSKGVEIVCTAKKKMCKTKQELYAFIERNIPTKKDTPQTTKAADQGHADTENQQNGYYKNSSFGFSLQYPSNLLTEKTYSQNGDGVWLENKSGTVILSTGGRYALDTQSIAQAYKDTIERKNEDKNTEITYKVQKKNWFALSGYNHENKTIFYEKRYFLYNRGEASNIIVGFTIEFPTKDKKKYNQLIDIVSKSFKPSNGESSKEYSELDVTNQDAGNRNTEDNFENNQMGNAESLFNLGESYSVGDGVKQDYSKAIEYYRKACDMSNVDGCSALGWLYRAGEHVKQDYSKAIEYYTKACDLGSTDECYDLGLFYKKGQGVKKDYHKALELFKKAADQDYSHAQFQLGLMYSQGEGVEQDYKKAAMFYQEAADHRYGYAEAEYQLGYMYANGQGVKQDYKKAMELYQQAADQGNVEAQSELKLMLANGQNVKQDEQKVVDQRETTKAKEQTPVQYASSQASEATILDDTPEMGIIDNIKAWYEKKKGWLIIGGLAFLYGLFLFLTRNKCTKCKSTNFTQTGQQHVKSYRKKESDGGYVANAGTSMQKHVKTYKTVQYDEYLNHYQCNDCQNIWTRKKKEKQAL